MAKLKQMRNHELNGANSVTTFERCEQHAVMMTGRHIIHTYIHDGGNRGVESESCIAWSRDEVEKHEIIRPMTAWAILVKPSKIYCAIAWNNHLTLN